MVHSDVTPKVVEQNLPGASSKAETKSTTNTWTETIETSVASIIITTTSTTIVTVTTTISPKRSDVNCTIHEKVTSCTKSTENESSTGKTSSTVSVLSSAKNSWDVESNEYPDSRQAISPAPSVELDVLLNDGWKMEGRSSNYKPQPTRFRSCDGQEDSAITHGGSDQECNDNPIPDHVDFRLIEKSSSPCSDASFSNFLDKYSSDDNQGIVSSADGVDDYVPKQISTSNAGSSLASPRSKVSDIIRRLEESRKSYSSINPNNFTEISSRHYQVKPPGDIKDDEGKCRPVESHEKQEEEKQETPKSANIHHSFESFSSINPGKLGENETSEHISCRHFHGNKPDDIHEGERNSSESSDQHQDLRRAYSADTQSTVSISSIIKKIRKQIDVSNMKRRSLEERRKDNALSIREFARKYEQYELKSIGVQLSVTDDMLSITPLNAANFMSRLPEPDYSVLETATERSPLEVTSNASHDAQSGNKGAVSNCCSPTGTCENRNVKHTTVSYDKDLTSCQQTSNGDDCSEKPSLDADYGKGDKESSSTDTVAENRMAAAETEQSIDKENSDNAIAAESEADTTSYNALQQPYDLTTATSFDSAVLLLLECSQTSMKTDHVGSPEKSTPEPGDISTHESSDICRSDGIRNDEQEHLSRILKNNPSRFSGPQILSSNYDNVVNMQKVVSSSTVNMKPNCEVTATGKIVDSATIVTESRSTPLCDAGLNNKPVSLKTEQVNTIQPLKTTVLETSKGNNRTKTKSGRSKGSFFGFGLFHKKEKAERRKSMPEIKQLEARSASYDYAAELSASPSLNPDEELSLHCQSFNDIENECGRDRTFLRSEQNASYEDNSSEKKRNEILGHLDLLIHNKADETIATINETKATHETEQIHVPVVDGTPANITTGADTEVQSQTNESKQVDDSLKTFGNEIPQLTTSEALALSETTNNIKPLTEISTPKPSTNDTEATVSIITQQENPTKERIFAPQDPLFCIKYVLRLQKAVQDSLLTEEQADAMTNLPKAVMHLIVYHFELCDSNDEPVDWDAMQKLVAAFAEGNNDAIAKSTENQAHGASKDATIRSSVETDLYSLCSSNGIFPQSGQIIESPGNRKRNFV